MENNILNTPIDETVKVEMTLDKMLGIIWFSEPQNNGRLLDYDEVLSCIHEKGITEGIMKEELKTIIREKKYDYKYVIAKGTAAENGQDAKIELLFDVKALNQLKPRENGDGTVDFKNLGAIRNVSVGEVLAQKVPATKGKNGKDVRGHILKAKPGKDIRLPKGKNTYVSEDGLKLISKEEGKLEYEDGIISVSTVYIIEGDVDNSIGNIDFVGSIVVNGTVHSGFVIKAKDSVEVKGPVEGATIIAGGDIILGYGVQGNETSRLQAGRNVIAKFIQNAYIEAEKDVVTEGIWNSTVRAGGEVKVDVGRGSIVGGNISATNEVSARNIGSPMGTLTGIQIGIQPNVYTEYKELSNIIRKEKEELKQIEKEITYLQTKNEEFSKNAKDFNLRRLQKLNYTKQEVNSRLTQHIQDYKALTKKLGGIEEGSVRVLDKIYPGVKIVMGNITKYIDHVQRACVFRRGEEDIYVEDITQAPKKKTIMAPQVNKPLRAKESVYIDDMGVAHYRKDKK